MLVDEVWVHLIIFTNNIEVDHNIVVDRQAMEIHGFYSTVTNN